MINPRPSDLELQVLSVLWENGPSTVRQILSAIPDGKKRAYTTVLTVMQVMEKKGLVSHTRDGLTHIYRPRLKKQQVLKPLMKELLKNVFRGSPSTALQYLLDDAAVDEHELSEIRKLISTHARHARKKGGK